MCWELSPLLCPHKYLLKQNELSSQVSKFIQEKPLCAGRVILLKTSETTKELQVRGVSEEAGAGVRRTGTKILPTAPVPLTSGVPLLKGENRYDLLSLKVLQWFSLINCLQKRCSCILLFAVFELQEAIHRKLIVSSVSCCESRKKIVRAKQDW